MKQKENLENLIRENGGSIIFLPKKESVILVNTTLILSAWAKNKKRLKTEDGT